MTLAKEPSDPNLKISSNRQFLVSISSALLDHQPILPALGPTPNAPASGDSIQSPTKIGSSFTTSSGGALAASSVGLKENQLMFVPPETASTLRVRLPASKVTTRPSTVCQFCHPPVLGISTASTQVELILILIPGELPP